MRWGRSTVHHNPAGVVRKELYTLCRSLSGSAMSKKQPEALRLVEMLTADEWPGSVTLVSYARECVAELRRLHASCQELESQLAQSFDAADMATAAAQGFRDGVASLAANAGGAVVNRATVIEWLDANDIEVTDRQLGGLFHFSAPPTAQAEGWVSMKDRLPSPHQKVILAIDGKHISYGCYMPNFGSFYWETCDDEEGDSVATHWMPLPAAPRPC